MHVYEQLHVLNEIESAVSHLSLDLKGDEVEVNFNIEKSQITKEHRNIIEKINYNSYKTETVQIFTKLIRE